MNAKYAHDPRRPIMVNGRAGELPRNVQYLLDHMWDECPKWPFGRTSYGYGWLKIHGKAQYAHRAVCAMVHGPAPTPKHEAAHSCGKGHEGCFGANCLEWKTPKENQADKKIHGTFLEGEQNGASILTAVQVAEILELLHEGFSQQEIANRYGVGQMAISGIRTGRTWKSIQRPYGADPKPTTSRYRGVTRYGSDRWIAQITRNKKNHHLGIFDTEEAAAAAFSMAAIAMGKSRTLR